MQIAVAFLPFLLILSGIASNGMPAMATYFILLSQSAFSSSIVDFGQATYLLKKSNKISLEAYVFSKLLLIVSTLILLFCLDYFKIFEIQSWIAAGIAIVTSAINVSWHYFQNARTGYFYSITFICKAVAFAFCVVTGNLSPEYLFYSQAASTLVANATLFCTSKLNFGNKNKDTVLKKVWLIKVMLEIRKSMVGSAPIFLNSWSGLLVSSWPTLIAGMGAEIVALFSIAEKIARLGMIFISPIYNYLISMENKSIKVDRIAIYAASAVSLMLMMGVGVLNFIDLSFFKESNLVMAAQLAAAWILVMSYNGVLYARAIIADKAYLQTIAVLLSIFPLIIYRAELGIFGPFVFDIFNCIALALLIKFSRRTLQ